MLHDLVHYAADHVHGDRETNSVRSESLRKHSGVDADQLAFRVDQGAARVAEVNRSIRLDEVFEIGDSEPAAAGRADDALGHRLTQSKWIADSEHDIPGA